MNYFKILILVALIVVSSSCEDYLNVRPKTEIPLDELFTHEDGFQEALTGAYIALKKNRLYGEALSMSTIEHLVSNWDVSSGSKESYLNKFDYTNQSVEYEFNSIYASMYNVIAQVNAILDNIDQANENGVFTTPGIYEMVKGECYAMRAFCHFDILRLFGPVPTESTSKPILSYMKELTKDVVPHISFESFKNELYADLQMAQELLEYDPIRLESVMTLRQYGDIFGYRDVRFNYYAVRAIQARAFLWFGEKEKAFEAANDVITAIDSEGESTFPLGNEDYYTAESEDFLLSCETILGLYVFNIGETYYGVFGGGVLAKGSSETIVKQQLYGNTGVDIRETHLWELIEFDASNSYYTIKKYKNQNYKSEYESKDIKMVPLIRVSEMYFIAIECTQDRDIAQGYWTKFQESRKLEAGELPEDIVSRNNFITHEYRKEFFAEGQAFFAYKRLNINQSNMLWVSALTNLNYVVPLPKSELVSSE